MVFYRIFKPYTYTYTGTNYHIFWSNQHPNNVKNKKLKLDKWEYLIFKSWVNGETPMCLFVPFLLVILFSGLAASNYPFEKRYS
jgi:hypothetical protein